MEIFSALLAICAGNSPVPGESPHKGQWRGALMLSLICVSINGWVNNREAGDLRRHRVHYYVTVMHYEMKCDWPGSSGFENRELSLCQLCCYWWYCGLSLWQPVALKMATKLPLWQLSVFSVSPSFCTISHRNVISRESREISTIILKQQRKSANDQWKEHGR